VARQELQVESMVRMSDRRAVSFCHFASRVVLSPVKRATSSVANTDMSASFVRKSRSPQAS
jgi:hypothetical protein